MNVHQVFKIWVDRNWRIMITIWLLIYVPIILFTILIHELMRIADGSILVTVIDLLVHYFVSVTGPSLILSFAVYAMILVVINLKNTDITSSLTHIKFKWLWHYFPIVWLGAVSPCLILASLQSGGLSLTDFIIPCIVSVVFSIIVFYVYLNRSHSARFRNRIINYCQKLSNDWKNAEYLLIWIGVFWVAPSYKIHAILGFGNSKPDFFTVWWSLFY